MAAKAHLAPFLPGHPLAQRDTVAGREAPSDAEHGNIISAAPFGSPSTVTTSLSAALAPSTRQAQTSVPSSSTEHEPHSPCSHAFFAPGRPSRSRRT